MTPTETPSPPRYVLVYGTLRRGEQRDINLLKPVPRWIGRAAVAGVLYDLGDYPGLRLCGSGTNPELVQGEVYEIPAALEGLLDEIEGVAPQPTGEYVKRELRVRPEPVQSRPEGDLVCLVYEIAADRTSQCPVIASGDWVSYRKQRRAPA